MKKVMVLVGGIGHGSLNRRFFDAVATLDRDGADGDGKGGDATHGKDGTGATGATGGKGGDATHATGATGATGATEGTGGTGRFDFKIFDIASLPHFSQDIENTPPESVKALRSLAAASDGVLIVTPEYNRSIPGVLKNALDWGSRPPGQSVWTGKPTAIMGAAPGGIGTFGAQQHLRGICSQLDMPVMNQPAVYFNATTGLAGPDGTPGAGGDRLTESSAAFMARFLDAFVAWIARFQK